MVTIPACRPIDLSTKVCKCDGGWMSFNETEPCQYEQKSKWTAFALSFFLGEFGADWFYLHNGNGAYIFAGIAKLMLPFIGESQEFYPMRMAII